MDGVIIQLSVPEFLLPLQEIRETRKTLVDESALGSSQHRDLNEFVAYQFTQRFSIMSWLLGWKWRDKPKDVAAVGISATWTCISSSPLAVKNYFASQEELLQKVSLVMSKLTNIKLAANLGAHTILSSVLRNVTRWSSTAQIFCRYFQLKRFQDHFASEPQLLVSYYHIAKN